MEDSRRFDFFSLTFFVGFGGGIFLGVGLAILAFALVDDPQPQTTTTIITTEPSVTPTTTPQPTPEDTRPVTVRALDVRLGPGIAFAVLGTISSGDKVTLQGRNDDGDWVAIQFPPGSTGRGWLPASGLSGLSLSEVSDLAVVAPTPLTGSASTPSFLPGTPGLDIGTPEAELTGTPGTPGANGTSIVGSPDLAVTRVQLLSDGHVRVTVGNRGPADVEGFAIYVAVYDAASSRETLRAPSDTLEVGETVQLVTSSLVVEEEKEIFATVDPSRSISDHDRSNNTQVVTLAPRATPTAAGPAD